MFSESERNVFFYLERWFDPLRVWRRLQQATQGELRQLLALAQTPKVPDDLPPEEKEAVQQVTPQQMAARDRLLEAVPHAFELPPFDPSTGTGLLEEQAMGLLFQYLAWMEEKKTKPSPSPTSSPTSGPPSWGDVPSTTPPSSA